MVKQHKFKLKWPCDQTLYLEITQPTILYVMNFWLFCHLLIVCFLLTRTFVQLMCDNCEQRHKNNNKRLHRSYFCCKKSDITRQIVAHSCTHITYLHILMGFHCNLSLILFVFIFLNCLLYTYVFLCWSSFSMMLAISHVRIVHELNYF